jgi:hypothetical protein
MLDNPEVRVVCDSMDLYVSARRSEKAFSWSAVLALVTVFLVPLALTLLAAWSVNARTQPNDEALTANFLSHEAKFDELIRMLVSDVRRLPLEGPQSVDLAGLSAALGSGARTQAYVVALRQISVADLRYFPASGKVILRPAGVQTTVEGSSSKSYVFMMSGRPEPLAAHQGYYRRGPALYFVSGDRHLKGGWFVHYDTAIALAFSPY